MFSVSIMDSPNARAAAEIVKRLVPTAATSVPLALARTKSAAAGINARRASRRGLTKCTRGAG